MESDWQNSTYLHYTGKMFGLGCSAFNQEAINKVNKLKQRTQNKGYIVLIPDVSWLERYGITYNPAFKRLIEQYWPGNLTFVMKDERHIFKYISYNDTIALRIPSQGFFRNFLYKIDTPFVSTSVNTSGEIPLLRYDDIIKQKKDWFDYAIIPHNLPDLEPVPSTIVGITSEEITFFREGSISFQEIKKSNDFPVILFVCTGNVCRSPLAEYYTRMIILREKLPFRVQSAGFLDNNIKISKNSYDILREYGIDASAHLSRKINRKIIEQSWLILAMEKIHKESLLEIEPSAVDKLHTFSEYCGKKYCIPNCDIEDPYGLEIYFYREAFKKIKERSKKLIEKISREIK